MIEGFEQSSLVILNLVNPKEKFFGVLGSLSAAGVTIRAINLDSFEDWIRQIAHSEEEPEIIMVTMFIPLFRVERIFLDEPAGTIKSYGERFEDVVGMPVRKYLGL
ncbi:MAG TPA: hypothetical protein VJ901_17355 [Thermoanaerobaculia bacterium]|nr:hypothetical protein [Thermoanaerobaculia bacterium]